MIRSANDVDTQAILDIWLAASIAAHDFVPAEFWRAQLDDMRTRYLPASQVFVYEQEGRVVGFHALSGHTLAALFVQPEWQGRGIGTALLSHARRLRGELTLSVYLANQPSVHSTWRRASRRCASGSMHTPGSLSGSCARGRSTRSGGAQAWRRETAPGSRSAFPSQPTVQLRLPACIQQSAAEQYEADQRLGPAIQAARRVEGCQHTADEV